MVFILNFRYLPLVSRNPSTGRLARACYLAVLASCPAGGGNLFNHKGDSIALSLSLSSTHCPDMVKVSNSLLAVGAVGVRVPLYLGHS